MASRLYTYPFIVGAVLIPLFGYLSDKFGNKGYFAILGGLFFNASFLCFYIKNECENDQNCLNFVISTLTLLGIGYGILQSVVWPSINLVVQ